jgi:HAE1 family hydrophobic/amphiphilic exporter-1/multidrug efflux pump
MAQMKVTATDVINAVKEQNAQFAAGKVGAEPLNNQVDFTFTVTTQGRMENPKQFEDIIVRSNADGSKLRVKDIARVELGALSYDVQTKWNGKTAIGIGVYLAPGANQVQTAEMVKETMHNLAQKFPPGLSYDIPFDTTKFIEVSIEEVIHTLVEAMILVFIVVYLFLQSWRATLIPCLAVPVSIIGTFAGMYALGFSINTLTLFGLVLAIGLVVDDAIVVLENVERIMRTEKLPVKDATIKAMEEVTSPVIAIVLVLSAVFIPVAFVGGLAGQMYKQFAITIAVSVAISGLVALTLTPALCAMLLKEEHHEPNRFFRGFNTFFDKLTNGYVSGVKFFNKRILVSVFIFLICVGGIVGLFKLVPGGLVPDEDQGYVFGIPNLQDGASLSRTAAVSDQMDNYTTNNPNVQDVFSLAGFDLISGSNRTNTGTSFVTLKDWKERKKEDQSAMAVVRNIFGLNQIIRDGAIIALSPPAIVGMSTTGGLEFYLQNRGGSDSKTLATVTKQFMDSLRNNPAIGSINSNFSANIPQIYLNLDREKAKAYQVPINTVFDAMSATFGSYYINDFNKFGRTFKVQLQSEGEYRARPEDIRNIYVRSDNGNMIPITALVNVKKVTGPELVERLNIFPAARIIANPAPGYSSGQVIKVVEDTLATSLSGDYSVAWTGTAYQEKLTGGASAQVFIYGLVFVFLILAAQYEKWGLPLSVLLSVPYSILGALIANYLRGLANDVYFQIALVTLIGLSAKNAILIVEFAVEKMHEGLSVADAAFEAAKLRFRPIVMTSLAFILGAVPLAISSGAGSASRHSIGTGIIGGMLVSTFVATFFIPMFFVVITGFKIKKSAKKQKESPQSPPMPAGGSL